ncbi:MAG: AAA family ATPase [Candidatus Omnitrophica bacterium]|nr:AAA family ATPase [Candidatus Omnitrophota bacterium]
MKNYLDNWEKIFGVRRAKRIFIAATRQNVGKTTISLGLLAAMRKRFDGVGFIKPVGQRYLEKHGFKVDEDSLLMDRIFDFGLPLDALSPVAIDKGFTERYLDGLVGKDANKQITDSFRLVAEGRDMVVIEGTGHAGVGSVFDLSNADVAKMLGAGVILVSPGGIGNPIDVIMLNKALFDSKGVRIAGVIVNKVRPAKYEKVNKYVRLGLNRLGIPVLGVVPYMEMLDAPTLRDFKEELDMHVLCGEEFLDRQTKKVLVGAMEVKEAVHFIENDCLMITPGDRTDLLNHIIKMHSSRYKFRLRMTGLVLSGGMVPRRRVFNALKKAGIPVLMTRRDTYDVASRIHDLTVKIKSRDVNKIKIAIDMFEKHVDMDAVTRAIG